MIKSGMTVYYLSYGKFQLILVIIIIIIIIIIIVY